MEGVARRPAGVTHRLLEICVDSLSCAVAAARAGADRIELCSDMSVGGTTPSAGLIRRCRDALAVPLHVMVRPRGGDFVHDPAEIEVMAAEIDFIRETGADGVVLGALTADGRVDVPNVERLIEASGPLSVTFHRAFDGARDADEALDALLGLGVDRVLSSGRARSALEGSATLARMVNRAGDRLVVMAGGGARADGVPELIARTGVTEVHARPVERRAWRGYHNPEADLESAATSHRPSGHDAIDAGAVRRLRIALDGVDVPPRR